MLKSDSAHRTAIKEIVDLREVHALNRVHEHETERTLERLAEDLVEHVLALCELRLITMRLEVLLEFDLCFGLSLRSAAKRLDSSRADRTLIGAGDTPDANLVKKLLDSDELLEVRIELLRGWSDAGGKHGVETLLADGELLRLYTLVLLSENERRRSECRVHNLAEEPVVQLLDRIKVGRESADLLGIALLYGVREP